MVSGGYYDRGLTSVEALFSNGTNYCGLPDLPVTRWYHSQDGLLACGGAGDRNDGDSCVTLSDGQWTQTHTLLHIREDHTSWALGDGRVMLMGGHYSGTLTEIITPESTSTEGFTLKYDTR